MQQEPLPTNTERSHTKSNCHNDLAAGICGPHAVNFRYKISHHISFLGSGKNNVAYGPNILMRIGTVQLGLRNQDGSML